MVRKDAELGFAGLAIQSGVKSTLASFWYVSDGYFSFDERVLSAAKADGGQSRGPEAGANRDD